MNNIIFDVYYKLLMYNHFLATTFLTAGSFLPLTAAGASVLDLLTAFFWIAGLLTPAFSYILVSRSTAWSFAGAFFTFSTGFSLANLAASMTYLGIVKVYVHL